jgi:GNAT superfamily N-acetyltransferase
VSEGIHITTLAERPELAADVEALKGSWPEFMMHEPMAERFYLDAPTKFADFVLVAVSADRPNEVLARAYSVPIGLADDPPAGLPDTGWDGAIRQAYLTKLAGYRGDAVCGLEVTIRPELRSVGLGSQMLRALYERAKAKGFRHFVAPVRPPDKAKFPAMSMREYAGQLAADGLPADNLLRANVKIGAQIIGIAPASMTVVGSLDQWRKWTGEPFDKDGPTIIEGALVPVHCDLRHEVASYVEPNVWMHRRL